MTTPPKIAVIALGNDKMGDDAAALLAARELKKIYDSKVQFIEIPIAGFALFDKIKGCEKILILDSVSTNRSKPGTIIKLHKTDLTKILSWSPHYIGMPEIFKFAEQMKTRLPDDMQILAIKIEDPYRISDGLCEAVQSKIHELVEKAAVIIESWLMP